MKKLWSVFVTIMLMFTMTACGGTAGNGGTQAELTNVASYEDCTLELLDANVITTEDGKTALSVAATYQNNGAEPLYAYCSFAVKAFQNDTELTDISNINGSEADLIREVKNGASLKVCYLFELSDNSDVEILVCTPTASEDNLAKNTYNVLLPQTNNDDAKAEYVGEWKANVIAMKTGTEEVYETYVIALNEDGTGSYRDKQGTWEYSAEEQRIILTLTEESVGVVLEISADGEKTVLKYYQDIYYRSHEFVEKVAE